MISWEYVVLLVIIGLITYVRKALDLLGSIFMIIMGVIIIFALSVALISLLTDIVYAFLDPRVRY